MAESNAAPALSGDGRRLIDDLAWAVAPEGYGDDVRRGRKTAPTVDAADDALSAYVARLEAEVVSERAGYEAALDALRDYNAENCPMDSAPSGPFDEPCSLCGAEADDDKCRAWSASVQGGLLGTLKAAHDAKIAAQHGRATKGGENG